ncbi:MAG: hypothetical protein A3J27_11730 [Candidatus Tectomicrobia bacterium RIFCSPLOWO2_12_FULL_69_37]|nr:MAG: hypothetical protein A3J27_11730 [Candidatus Tectomicrobia bacterium RIFCSPLOWO2_12_FULL_69_37]OGL59099.1 MAG: hypothetical protein A3I72_06650 [Candidatus Tectomicrobia bacterium RIFCSPLOWO2_02_FULL_70_19]
MIRRILAVLIKIGLVAEGMSAQRALRGPARLLGTVAAIAFSYFFIHVAFFGPPVAEIFKGAYILGTAVLCILFYKGRQAPLRENYNWLDEIFSLLATASMGGFLLLGAYWLMNRVEIWEPFFADPGAKAAFALGLLLGAALYWREATRSESPEGFSLSDWLYLFSVTASIVWWMSNNVQLQNSMGGPVPALVVISAGLIICVSVDIARRIVGPLIPLIGMLFLLYTFGPVARLSPGLLFHEGFRVSRVAEFLLLEADGLTGLIVNVFANFVVIFVVLGAFLEKTGLGSLFIDATFRLTGQRTGGPGLTAVVSSGLFGMISGSGVANVVTTGTFTIPLMKRVGYRPEFAAAVEAAASTGGAYMPPVMGAGAFLLAQFTEISYFEVIKVAAIPAVLYYLSVGYIVYIRAVRRGLRGVPLSELPPWSRILPRLHLLLPIPAMVYYLVIGDSAFLAAFKTICLIVLLKISDLLAYIRTPWSGRLGWSLFSLSILSGLFSYFFGLWVGPPFSWFADTLRGLNLGDALLWTVAAYSVLKLGEILLAAVQAPAPAASSAGGEPAESGPVLFQRLWESLVELAAAVWTSLEAGARNTLVIGCLAGVLGVLLSSATQSDLPGRVSNLLIEFSFGLLPLTIFWVIVAGYIVGMGLPISASYVVLVIFGVLSLTNLGVPTLTAHLICFWVAVVSAVTPPVALAAYAASAIAMSDPVKTGFQAVKLASWVFLMPFLFVYTPLLLDGTTLDIVITVAACLAGIVAWGGVVEGFVIRHTTLAEWGMLAVASAFLLLPVDHLVTWLTPVEWVFHHYPFYAAGAALLLAVFLMQRARPAEEILAVAGAPAAKAAG